MPRVGIFELVVISTAAEELLPWKARWLYIVAGGILTTGRLTSVTATRCS